MNKIRFFEVAGRKAPSPLERAGGEVIIDISHLAKGLYFLKTNNKVTKFIIIILFSNLFLFGLQRYTFF